MGSVDKQTMDQILELQNRTNELRRHLAQITAQLQSAENERAILQLSLNHLDQLSDDVKTFKPLGKMFVMHPKPQLKSQLEEGIQKSKDDAAMKEKLRDQFATKLKENDAQADELISEIEKSTVPPSTSQGK